MTVVQRVARTELQRTCKIRQQDFLSYQEGTLPLPQINADIIHICGFDSYNPTTAIINSIEPHESGNYIVYNFLRNIKKYSSVMILTDLLGQVLTRHDDDTIGIPIEKVLDSIVECKIIVLHDDAVPFEMLHELHAKLNCKFVFISQTHYHLTHPDGQGDPSYPELMPPEIKKANEPLILEKKSHFDKLPIYMVVGSSYSYALTVESPLYKKENVNLIPLPADIPFCKSPKEAVRKHLSLDLNKRYIFWGTTSPHLPRKGYKYFKEAMIELEKILSPEQKDKIEIMHAGHQIDSKCIGPFSVQAHGYVTSRKDMSVLYRAAHVSICTTLADAGPMMVSESLCNGTPVISFPRCIASDLVEDGVSGYLITAAEPRLIAQQTKRLLFEDNLEQMTIDSRQKYLNFHNKEHILQLWEEFLDKIS